MAAHVPRFMKHGDRRKTKVKNKVFGNRNTLVSERAIFQQIIF